MLFLEEGSRARQITAVAFDSSWVFTVTSSICSCWMSQECRALSCCSVRALSCLAASAAPCSARAFPPHQF